ncbi:uncharacterized protein LOC128674245 [Plodia interpunctella]|uniref:uncharacterized protein LOC128674245 n=1 Tax=Plodia interpunctella TaxID=58824 RepID=UPI003101452E
MSYLRPTFFDAESGRASVGRAAVISTLRTAVGGAREMARYTTITPSMSEAVLQHLRDSFFADEPLNKAVGLCERGQPHAALERLCSATMLDGLSIAVVEGDTVLGVALNGIL